LPLRLLLLLKHPVVPNSSLIAVAMPFVWRKPVMQLRRCDMTMAKISVHVAVGDSSAVRLEVVKVYCRLLCDMER